MEQKNVITKGNVIVNNIKIGDIHFEYEYGMAIKSRVITLPQSTKHEDGSVYWSWTSQHILADGTEVKDDVIQYGVTEGMSHYGPNLYDYEAYQVKRYV